MLQWPVKAPKAHYYSVSESADYRYACAVNQKNIGEAYIQVAKEKLISESGENTKKHVERIENIKKSRAKRINDPEFKKRRLFLKKK